MRESFMTQFSKNSGSPSGVYKAMRGRGFAILVLALHDPFDELDQRFVELPLNTDDLHEPRPTPVVYIDTFAKDYLY
jgi:hypothetical protein